MCLDQGKALIVTEVDVASLAGDRALMDAVKCRRTLLRAKDKLKAMVGKVS